jgi:hypothetical protein
MLKRGKDEWYVVLRLKPGRYQYKFVVDGTWMADPENNLKQADNYGGFNSVAVVGN